MQKLFVAALFSTAMWAQNPAVKVEFEVASIRSVPPLQRDQMVNIGLHLDGAQAHIVSFALKDYIAMAYRVKAYQVSGPDWLSERFDLNAKLPAGSTADQIPEMLQALLADRLS